MNNTKSLCYVLSAMVLFGVTQTISPMKKKDDEQAKNVLRTTEKTVDLAKKLRDVRAIVSDIVTLLLHMQAQKICIKEPGSKLIKEVRGLLKKHFNTLARLKSLNKLDEQEFERELMRLKYNRSKYNREPYTDNDFVGSSSLL